ncbi:hypothetical protein C6A85_40980, partial [Mycobacterium sp. ITM-2017-0098]
PEDYRGVADRQRQMADSLRVAVDSVDAPDIKKHLRSWADGALELAALQTAAAQEPGGRARPSDADFERVARVMNDAAVSLGEQCP